MPELGFRFRANKNLGMVQFCLLSKREDNENQHITQYETRNKLQNEPRYAVKCGLKFTVEKREAADVSSFLATSL